MAIQQLKGDVCGHGDTAAPGAAADDGDDFGEGDASDTREWKPEVCFTATDVEYGGRVVDLTRNITRGPMEKIPGRERMWRVPHNVKVRGPREFGLGLTSYGVCGSVDGTEHFVQSVQWYE